MATSADQYYTNLVEGIPLTDINEWTIQIEYAEQHRMEDKSVMDIIGAGNVPTAPESASEDEDSDVSIVSEWLQLAIEIEEQQYAEFYFDCCFRSTQYDFLE